METIIILPRNEDLAGLPDVSPFDFLPTECDDCQCGLFITVGQHDKLEQRGHNVDAPTHLCKPCADKRQLLPDMKPGVPYQEQPIARPPTRMTVTWEYPDGRTTDLVLTHKDLERLDTVDIPHMHDWLASCRLQSKLARLLSLAIQLRFVSDRRDGP